MKFPDGVLRTVPYLNAVPQIHPVNPKSQKEMHAPGEVTALAASNGVGGQPECCLVERRRGRATVGANL